MPSSLTRVLSITLGFSPRLPVSVCGTGTSHLARGFSGSVESGTSLLHFARHHSSALWETDLPISQPNCLDADIQYRAYPILLRPPIAQMVRRWYRNINLLSIAYAFRPRLRSRLTLSGRAFLRKPSGVPVEGILTPLSLLIPAFSLLSAPPVLPVWLHSP